MKYDVRIAKAEKSGHLSVFFKAEMKAHGPCSARASKKARWTIDAQFQGKQHARPWPIIRIFPRPDNQIGLFVAHRRPVLTRGESSSQIYATSYGFRRHDESHTFFCSFDMELTSRLPGAMRFWDSAQPQETIGEETIGE
jgi:hypothetical protein